MFDSFRCARAAVYYNTDRLTPAQIKEQTGCSHIVNGWVFNTKFKPCNWLVLDGEVISSDKYKDWGFACDKTGAPKMATDRSKSYLSAVPLLKNGAKLDRSLTPDVARKAERTAVGWYANGNIFLWCDPQKLTRTELQDKLLGFGITDALMLDGGGSVQGIFPDGTVTSSRKVATLLLFWQESATLPEPTKEEPMVDIHAYSLKKDGNKNLTAHFKVREFAPHDGSDTVFIAKLLPIVCEYVRMRCGKSVVPSNGYRPESHNKTVEGAAEYSQHMYGTAADLMCPAGVTPKAMAGYAREIMPDWGGVGVYSNRIHVDVREEKADWVG